MFYPHQQSTSGTSASKHHDANGDVRLGGGGGGGGGGGDSRGGGGGWARHPSFTPSGMPMPSPGGYPALGGGGGGGGGGGYVPPPVGGAGGHGHHQHAAHVHSHGGLHSHGPHHPSFGNTGSSAGLGGPGGAGGLGGGHGPAGYGGMAMFGGGGGVGGGGQQNSPPRNEPSVPLTQHWQNQLMRADASRLSASPHHRARAAAISSRATNKPSAITITDPNNRPNSSQSNAGIALNGVHRKQTSLSVLSRNDSDRGITPPPPPDTPGHESADPATPNVAPAHDAKEDDRPAEPWTGLDLGGIKLRTISTALFSFTHITSLYINHNCITSIPPAVSQLRNLTLLDATGNDLSSIPPEIGVLSRLKELLLFDNHLTTLPFELGTLYNLETLGIEGNPLDERLRKLLAEEGTTGLITYMRDNCSAGPAPPERQWVEIEPDVSSPSSGEQETFTVLTYNILCASFAPAPTYMYTPSWALDWNYRKHVILNEIVQASADVVCLQEIDCEQYAEFFLPQLKKHGYEGQHYPRSRARTMSAEEQKAVDGCATFWKDERFSLVETQVVEFNQLAISKTDMRTEDMFNRVMSRDNIAVVAKLEFRASGARLLVCNSHIYWDHRYRDVKLVQIGMLVEELEKIVDNFTKLPAKLSSDPEYNHGRGPPKYDRLEKGRDIPLIMCVDLNSLSGSAVYDYLSTGEIAGDHEDFMSHVYGTYTNKGLRHRLGLRSACASFGELKMTNYTPTFSAAIDYIFYTPRNMKVTSVLGDVDKEYLDKVVGFPNAHFPSDHIPVFAQFRLKGQSDSNGNTY